MGAEAPGIVADQFGSAVNVPVTGGGNPVS